MSAVAAAASSATEAPPRRWERWPGALQHALLALVVGAVCVAVVALLDGSRAALAAGAAAALAVGIASTLWARRTAQAWAGLEAGARALASADRLPEAPLAFAAPQGEALRARAALHQALDAARRREEALVARAAALGVQLEHRTHELSTLERLSTGLASSGDIETLVREALDALEQTLHYHTASVWARADLEPAREVVLLGCHASDPALGPVDDLVGGRLSRANLQRYEQMEREARPVVENRPRASLLSWLWELVTDDARTSALYRATKSWMAVPLKVREQVLGVLRVDSGEAEYFDDARARLLCAVGSQAALAMRHAHLLGRERDMAVMSERNRIARDLHDAVSQTLFAASLMASALARSAEGPLQVQARSLERLNRSALAEMRMLMFELKPDAMQAMRLPELLQQAIEALAGRGDIEVVPSISRADDGLPPEQRVQVYRIAQEALSNLGRHSGASRAEVEWTVLRPGHARLRIADNGHGFDPAQAHPGHFGIENMHGRAAELGAAIELRSTPGTGTELVLELAREPVTA